MNSIYSLIDQHFSAIIGVAGTLLGVVLGSLLNRISRYGRVRFYTNNIEYEYGIKDDGYGGYMLADSFIPETTSISITIELDIINTSEYSKKILRDINFLTNDKRFNKAHNLKDLSTGQLLHSSLWEVDDLKSINLQPKEIRNLKFRVHFNEDLEKVLNSKWYLKYKKPNNRVRKIKIKHKPCKCALWS